MSNGYIKLSRKMLDWEYFKDTNTTQLFITILLKAAWKETTFRGVELKRGELYTSLKNLSEISGLTLAQVRTSINKLELARTITSRKSNFGTIIKVLNYGKYQMDNTQNDTQNSTQIDTQYNTQNSTLYKKNIRIKNKEYIYSDRKPKYDTSKNPSVSEEEIKAFLKDWKGEQA